MAAAQGCGSWLAEETQPCHGKMKRGRRRASGESLRISLGDVDSEGFNGDLKHRSRDAANQRRRISGIRLRTKRGQCLFRIKGWTFASHRRHGLCNRSTRYALRFDEGFRKHRNQPCTVVSSCE